MAKYNLYGPFAGVRDVFTLLTLMDDKKKRKEFLNVAKTLEEERGAINEAIEVYGKASKIEGLVMSAEAKDREAEAALAMAKESAGQIQTDAKTWAGDLRSKIVEREEAVTAGEKKLAENEAHHKADVDRWEDKMKKRETEVFEQQRVLGSQIAEAKKIKERHTIALASMKAGVAAA